MNNFTDNTGLKFIAEEIFIYLDFEDLERCKQVCESWKLILNNPSFWLRKCIQYGGFKTNNSAWKMVVEDTKHTYLEGIFTLHFKGICSIHASMNKDTLTKIWQGTLKREDVSPIYWAAENGHVDVIKALIPLCDFPNDPLSLGICDTPIHKAANNGHVDVIKLLKPLTDNPNCPDYLGNTPTHLAARNGHAEVVELLASDNPGNLRGETPISHRESIVLD